MDEEGFTKSGAVDHKYTAPRTYVMLNFWIVLAENGDFKLMFIVCMEFSDLLLACLCLKSRILQLKQVKGNAYSKIRTCTVDNNNYST